MWFNKATSSRQAGKGAIAVLLARFSARFSFTPLCPTRAEAADNCGFELRQLLPKLAEVPPHPSELVPRHCSVMSRSAAPAPGHGRQPAPPSWPRDRSGLWLRNAATGLCLLAAAAAMVVVSFTAQYRMVDATGGWHWWPGWRPRSPMPRPWCSPAWGSRWPCTAAGDPGPDPESGLGRGQRVHERHRGRAGWRNLAIWAMPPVAYALASDTLIAEETASSGPGPWPAASS